MQFYFGILVFKLLQKYLFGSCVLLCGLRTLDMSFFGSSRKICIYIFFYMYISKIYQMKRFQLKNYLHLSSDPATSDSSTAAITTVGTSAAETWRGDTESSEIVNDTFPTTARLLVFFGRLFRARFRIWEFSDFQFSSWTLYAGNSHRSLWSSARHCRIQGEIQFKLRVS